MRLAATSNQHMQIIGASGGFMSPGIGQMTLKKSMPFTLTCLRGQTFFFIRNIEVTKVILYSLVVASLFAFFSCY